MKINAKTILKNLKGEALKDSDDPVTLGSAIGNILIGYEVGGKMKCYTLATKFTDGAEVEVDASDLKLIKDATEKTKVYNNLVSGQVLVLLEAVKAE